MTDDLHDANDLIRKLEGLAIRTSQGTFVKLEDVRGLVEKREAAKAIDAKGDGEPEPKTMTEARDRAKKFLKEQAGLPSPPNVGRAIPANEPQPSSRT